MINDTQFPTQSARVGTRIKGVFLGIIPFEGELIREDDEPEGIRLVRLDDGKILLGTISNGDVFQ